MLVEQMLDGDLCAAREWAQRQTPTDQAALAVAASLVQTEVAAQMMRDPAAFLGFKTPATPPPIASDRFRSMIEAAMGQRPLELAATLRQLDLGELWAVSRICIVLAATPRPAHQSALAMSAPAS